MNLLSKRIPFENDILAFGSLDISTQFCLRFSRKGKIATKGTEIYVEGYEQSEIGELENIVQELIDNPLLRVTPLRSPLVFYGSGSPENKIEGNIGDTYHRIDKNDESNFYVKTKENGNPLGWTPK